MIAWLLSPQISLCDSLVVIAPDLTVEFTAAMYIVSEDNGTVTVCLQTNSGLTNPMNVSVITSGSAMCKSHCVLLSVDQLQSYDLPNMQPL